MFKAGELDNVIIGEHQRQLFEFYLRSSHHNLDTLLPAESIEVHTLHGETHHTWVQNDSLVALLCAQISDLLSTPTRAKVGLATHNSSRDRVQERRRWVFYLAKYGAADEDHLACTCGTTRAFR